MDNINYADRWVGKVKRFNKNFPVETSVVFIKDNGEWLHTKITYPAILMSNNCPVVWIEGIRESVRLEQVIVI